MSLLDTASLLLTPNAYKEGKLYSVIPSDGSGDFTFTRATTATRVNSDGLVELVPYNLVERSEEFNNAVWTKVNSTATANTETAPNGTLTADTITDNSTSGSHAVVRFNSWSTTPQTFSVYVKPNTLTKFYISNTSTGNAVCFNLTTSTIDGYTNGSGNAMTNASVENVGNGWFRVSATQTATASQTLTFGFYKVFNATSFGAMATYIGTGESAYIWGAQLVEGTNALPYQKTETRLNIPRLDYSLGGCPSILLEPQRTNLVINSVFSGSGLFPTSWNAVLAGGTSTSTASIFTKLGQAWTFTVSNNRQIMAQFYGFTAGSTTSFSVFVEAATDGIQVQAVVGQFQGGTETYFKNGVPCANTEVIEAGNRYTSVMVASASGSQQMRLGIGIRGNVTGSVTLSMPQFEAGAYATSYIPTTTASVTRNNEVYNRTGVSSLIGQTEGTMFVDFFAKTPSELRRMSISDGTLNNRIVIVHRTTGEIQFIVVNGGVTQADFVTSAIYQSNQEVKVAFAYKANDFIAYINGAQAFTDTSGTVPTTSRFGFTDGDGTSFPFNNSVKLATLWKERLTNDQLAQLTTI